MSSPHFFAFFVLYSIHSIWAVLISLVVSLSDGLEEIVSPRRVHFKSEGERKIAYFLDSHDIRYQYETGVLVNTPYRKTRIWYPDFYLPQFASYIEYFGLVGKKNYDEGVKNKLLAYQQMSLDVIPVYPWTFSDDWQKYIMAELEKTTLRRYKTLRSNKYWSTQKSFSKYGNKLAYGKSLGRPY